MSTKEVGKSLINFELRSHNGIGERTAKVRGKKRPFRMREEGTPPVCEESALPDAGDSFRSVSQLPRGVPSTTQGTGLADAVGALALMPARCFILRTHNHSFFRCQTTTRGDGVHRLIPSSRTDKSPTLQRPLRLPGLTGLHNWSLSIDKICLWQGLVTFLRNLESLSPIDWAD